MSASPTDQQLIDFVVREARLLDQQRLEDWLDLFTEDGHYWMPVEWGQAERRADEQTFYVAWVTHHLTTVDGALKIRLKRVDLINCDAALGSIQLFV
jgi:3-phenylpropionate/cinnamic acid dioxygenase small subunit